MQFGALVQTPARTSDTKNYIYLPARGGFNLGQRLFAYNTHTVCCTFKNLVSPDSLNGAELLCNGHAHFGLESFFAKSRKLENLLFELRGILSDLHETWHVHSSAGPDLQLSKEFCLVKKMCKLLTNTFL